MPDITLDTRLRAVTGANARPAAAAGGAKKAGGFGDVLDKAITEVNELQKVADEKATALATGESMDVHGTMLALEKGDLAFRLMTQVRSKLLEAYQEVMRMQV